VPKSILTFGKGLLLLLIFSDIFLYYACYNVELIKTKLSARDISLENDNLEVFKVPISRYNKDGPDEFIKDGKLYDVIKAETIRDTVYVSVINDKPEQEILAKSASLFSFENSKVKQDNFDRQHKASLWDVNKYCSDCQVLLYHNPSLLIASFKSYPLLSGSKEVASPPPRFQS
jgi:hypothetical protein